MKKIFRFKMNEELEIDLAQFDFEGDESEEQIRKTMIAWYFSECGHEGITVEETGASTSLFEKVAEAVKQTITEFEKIESMNRVIIESPYKGNIKDNTEYARLCLKDSLRREEAPIASHLLHTQVLDESDPEQRAIGLVAGWAWIPLADKLAVYTNLGISDGMRSAIQIAEEARIPIEYRTIQ